MTQPHLQPEYIITEDPISELQSDLLEAFTTGNKDADSHALSVILSCFQQYMKKVRSRPHTPAPEPNPCEENGCTDIDICDEICEHIRIYSPAYVRESRQKARAEVLDLLIAYRKAQSKVFGVQTAWEGEGAYILELRQQEGKP